MQEDLSEGRPVSWLAVPANDISSPITTSFFTSAALSISVSVPLAACSPALPQQEFEAVWTAIRHGQLQAVVAHSPDDGG